MKFSKNVNNKKHAPKLIFFNEKKKLRKIRIIFDIENWLWKSEIGNFRSLDLEQCWSTKIFFMKKCYFSLIWCESWWKILKCYLLCKSYSLFIHFSLYILGMYILQASYQHPLWNFVQERNCFLLSHYTLAVCSTGKSLCKEWNYYAINQEKFIKSRFL